MLSPTRLPTNRTKSKRNVVKKRGQGGEAGLFVVLLDCACLGTLEIRRLELDDLAQRVQFLGRIVVVIPGALEPDAETVWYVPAEVKTVH